MYQDIYSQGAIVKISMGFYEHLAIVSERWGNTRPNLISLTSRTGTVREESWEKVAGDRPVRLAEYQGDIAPSTVLSRARSMIGKVRYNLFTSNCEHFVKWVHGLEITSNQVFWWSTVTIGGIAGLIYFSRK